MANCPVSYKECRGICHFRQEGYCCYSLPAKPISEFRTTGERIADLEAQVAELEGKRLPPEQKKQKPKFTGGISIE